jgi:predicted trehalose synthase
MNTKPTAGVAIRLSLERLSGVHAAMARVQERAAQGMPPGATPAAVRGWIQRLRAAADELEKML